ncbi:YbfB/YjiJ family MFS transporter [Fodinicurvata sediminis]|uniref:YbfB/YjiJ family MFS transporter n=1 Tax=Fodinicurvata sediminis TaxID=1121832 RepID=UPI0003B7BBCA|nr:YbfB/YjiJ family MFS transporter [Fodinicurvata sediminis]
MSSLRRGQTLDTAALKVIAAAFLAVLVGIGLSRFAYTPLLPAIIEAGWFEPGQAAYLGAANLAGYLLGALCGQRLTRYCTPATALRLLMLVATAAFAASALPISFGWYFLWRLLSGLTGGALMVIAAPSALAHSPQNLRGLASGAIFTGVGLGIVLSGTLVPLLLSRGLVVAWLGLALLSLCASLLVWWWWPRDSGRHRSQDSVAPLSHQGHAAAWRSDMLAIYASYGLTAIGLVPHMVFLADFVARGLGQGVFLGGVYWAILGLGALLGPLASGRLADHVGFGTALRTLVLINIVTIGLLSMNHAIPLLVLSSLLGGAAITGSVTLVLGQTRAHIADPLAHGQAWSLATVTFALGQAVSGYGFSWLFARSDGDFGLLFLIASLALLLAFGASLLSRFLSPGRLRL